MNLLRSSVLAILFLSVPLFACAQSTAEWIADANGCKAWNPNPRPNESIKWSGPCTNGMLNGEGTLEWFLDGNANGTNSGTFTDGKQTGHGTSVSANGDRYDGEFANGVRQGAGTIQFANGNRYEGPFASGRFHGAGTLQMTDGTRLEGRWNNGTLFYGQMIWSNGNAYFGEFSQGHRTGRGNYTWANGDRYDGSFVDGKFQGAGVITKANGDKIDTSWDGGKPTGRATITRSNGSRIAGTYTDGKFAADGAPSGATDPLTGVVDAVAPRDLVTGQRSLNIESEAEEVKRATAQAAQLIRNARSRSIAVDADQAMIEKLRSIMARIAQVSHRPNLPWEIHLFEDPTTVNAKTIGGGKLFFWRGVFGGLINPRDDNEIAAVMAHEIGHVNLRHVGKREGINIGRLLLSNAKPGTDTMYQASFTTLQEDEADKIGLLYMSLAGFDPRAAPRIWARALKTYGSSPGNYTYDHSLNADRMRKVAALTPTALQYFKGDGVQNPDFARLRSQNDLMPRLASGESDNGVLALLEAGLGVYADNLQAKNEERSRQIAMQSTQQTAVASARIVNFKIANTTVGTRGVFGQVQNVGQYPIQAAQITVYYQDAAGRILYTQQIPLPAVAIQRGGALQWSGPLLNVAGATKVLPKVTAAYLAQ